MSAITWSLLRGWNGKVCRHGPGVLAQRGECGICALGAWHGSRLLGVQLGLECLLIAFGATALQLARQLHAHVTRLRAPECLG